MSKCNLALVCFRRPDTGCFFRTWLAFVWMSVKDVNTLKICILFTGNNVLQNR